MIKKNSHKNLWSEAELAAWALPEEMTVSQWADRYRKLDESAAEPGQWRTDRVPYLRGIMDTFTDPAIERIVLKTSTQVGKTQTINNILGYITDQDPGPALYVLPTKEDAEDVAIHTIKPFVFSNEVIARHLTGERDDITKKKFVFDRMILYITGAGSPSSLARRSIRYVLFDEVNKFPVFAGREADPLKLASERQRAFWNRKTVMASTPTTPEGYISKEYEKSDQRQYYVPCPHCGHYQTLIFGQLKFPKEVRNPTEIKLNRLSWYECSSCNKRIDDKHKQEMLMRGKWVCAGQAIDKKGRISGERKVTDIAGFHINALYSPFLTFSEIAAEWLDSYRDIAALMNFTNSWLAEEFEEKVQEITPDKLDKNISIHARGSIPDLALALTAGVDVQINHFWFVIRAWGYGEESWLVREGRLETWEQVSTVLFGTQYFVADTGIFLPVNIACIDSAYRTDEVYDYCLRRPETRPTKTQDRQKAPWYANNIPSHTLANGKVVKGITLYHLDKSYFLEKIHRHVDIVQGELGSWHLHSEITQDYKDQMSAEVKRTHVDKHTRRRTEQWVLRASGAANHYMACEINATAAADMLGLRFVSREIADDMLNQRLGGNLQKRQEEEAARSGYLQRKSGWLKKGE